VISRRKVVLGGGAVVVAGVGTAVLGAARANAMKDYAEAVATRRAALLSSPDALDLIRFATLAPSGHNTQPWKFRIAPQQITILPDFTQRTPVVDPDDHHLYVSLGCAAENLSVASHARSNSGELRFIAADRGAIEFSYRASAPNGSTLSDSTLCDAIPKRQSTRADFDSSPVTVAELRELSSAAMTGGVDVVFITDRPQINRIRDLVIAGNTTQIADPAFVRELKAWLRFNPRDALATGDGLFSASSGSPTLPRWLGPKLFDLAFTADAENEKYAQQIDTSSGLAVFVAEQSTPEHWVAVGRACQRFALQATAMGLKHSFVNQPVEVAALRTELASIVGMTGRRPDLVMRFGRGPTLPYSARRSVSSTIIS
jgi:Nitroreductase family